MACSIVAVEESIADEFIEQLVQKANEIKIGNGLDDGVFLGPVIRNEHQNSTLQYIETGIHEGATLVRDGHQDKTHKEKNISCVRRDSPPLLLDK